MSYLSKRIIHKNLLAIVVTLPSFVLASDIIKIESAIIFNTSCARCHEGECSGRLSFHLPKGATDQHIRRYGGELSLGTIRQLFELLRYMKEECSFYPLSLALTKDRIWGSDTLAKLRSPSNHSYFMPLGLLGAGLHQLLLEGLNENTSFYVEIVNSEFDFFGNEIVNGESEQKVLLFQVDVRSEYFLRITAQQPIFIKRLELVVHGNRQR